jgi:rod shape-determining protein MreC
MLSGSSKTHQAFFASTANEVTGKINKKYYGFIEYFSLKETNKQLAEENARLKNLLRNDFQSPDSTTVTFIDTLIRDSLNRFRKYTYLPAKVVGNTVTSNTNYLMLERGSKQGVVKDMSVVSPQGIVGVVVEVSDNYCKVMSLLHRNSRVSAMLKKNNSSGDVEWDGSDPHFVTMKKVSKGGAVVVGDTVVTSSYSSNFPSNVMIGRVTEVKPDPASSFNNLKVKTSTNFFNIQYVYLVQNSRFEEQKQLTLKKDTKNNE